MSGAPAEFALFLRELGLGEELITEFARYHALLWAKNQELNLFSRSTPEEELWTKHFLDSLLPLKCLDLTGKSVLDFGSGGGLPGIPLKLAVPDCRMTLLDSVRKKTLALQEMLGAMALEECRVLWSRLEDMPGREEFDLILCRAVRLEERYLAPLWRLLKPDGMVVFYKALEFEDIAAFQPRLLIERDFPFGHRALWALERAQLKR